LAHLAAVVPEFPDILLPADLRRAYLGIDTTLDAMTLGNQEFGFVSVADVRWGGVNLAVVPWTRIPDSPPRERLKWVMLGDEREARGKLDRNGRKKPEILRFDELEAATRANRQLTTILRD
jgi:hypothetical protein